MVNMHQHLAAHVHALVIVPFELRRGDAVAHEHRVAFETARPGCCCLADAHEIVAASGSPAPCRPPRPPRVAPGCGFDAHQRHLLEIGAVFARRLGAGQGELRGDVFGGQIAAARARRRGLPADRSTRNRVCSRMRSGGDAGVLRQEPAARQSPLTRYI